MSNSFFRFKQMTIHQEHCAMKVSTDACIQGAWTKMKAECYSILDIGTGTGLLSLMLAQRNPKAQIDALEIDHAAAQQAAINFEQSPFGTRIQLHHCDASKWKSPKEYDLIICNPPFFSNSLKSHHEQRKLARHNDSLSFIQLAQLIQTHLKPTGQASILLPTTEELLWQKAANQERLFLHESCYIKPFAARKANRLLSIIGKYKPSKALEEELVIYQSPKVYSEDFKALMRDFYLYL